MDYRLPGSSVHGDSPGKNTGMGCHTLLQGIFPTQGSNPVLLHRRQILYHLSHQGSPFSLLPWNKYFLPVKKWNSHLLSLLFFFYLTFMKPLFVTRVWVSFSRRLILYLHTCLERSWWSWWLWVFDSYTGQEWVKPIKTQWVQWLVGENYSRAHKGMSCQLLEPTGCAKFRGHPHSPHTSGSLGSRS